jgi:hypothetical protein
MPVFIGFVRRLAEGEDLLISNEPQGYWMLLVRY